MPIVCWGNLAKSADSTQRIEQSIQAYLEGHDENPNAHMGTDYALGAHRLQTTLDHPYNSVGWYHILDLHADRMTAGALVIKGNGPYIVVQDETYAERVRIYPEGIIIKKGRLVLQSDSDSVIIDEKGLHGSNIFYSNAKAKVYTSDIPNYDVMYPISEMDAGFYLSRPTPVMVFGTISGDFPEVGGVLELGLEFNTEYFPMTAEGFIPWSFLPISATNLNIPRFSFIHVINLYAGFNRVRLIGSTRDFTGNFAVNGDAQSTFGYMILGNG